MTFQDIPRKQATEILDDIREWLAERVPPEEIERRLANSLQFPSILPLQPCHHEGGAFTDHCYGCAPRWGWTGPKVRIR